ncbi:BMP and activin membrane-bound inhibitor homolog [Tubulanus polymorphus]|uniref:BMP and activin membrane-bound inhibitor homolog n=1 Tax=Tubulanus polymorphus TaxID=672921 RepID=UPI003DA2D037
MDYQLTALICLWIIFSLRFTLSAGEIRCYCNTPSCISTGYMCKSARGRCFSRRHHEYGTPSSDTIHGCIEKLTPKEQIACRKDGGVIVVKNAPSSDWPVVTCCKTDMCNYVDSLNLNFNPDDSSNRSVPKKSQNVKLNKKQSAATSGSDDVTSNDRGRYSLTRDGATSREDSPAVKMTVSQQDIWFKAAVIAVPIAGGFILILLVLLAMRLLKNDRREQSRAHHSLVKAQLFVADHFFDKNLKRSPHRTFRGACANKTYSNHVFSDVGIKIDPKEYPYEKLGGLDLAHKQSSRNSIVLVRLPDAQKDVSNV